MFPSPIKVIPSSKPFQLVGSIKELADETIQLSYNGEFVEFTKNRGDPDFEDELKGKFDTDFEEFWAAKLYPDFIKFGNIKIDPDFVEFYNKGPKELFSLNWGKNMKKWFQIILENFVNIKINFQYF